MNMFNVNEYKHWSSMLSVLEIIDHGINMSRPLMEYMLTDLWLGIRVRGYGDDGRIRIVNEYVMFYGEQETMYPTYEFDNTTDLLIPYIIRHGETGHVLTETDKQEFSKYLTVCTDWIGTPRGFDVPMELVGNAFGLSDKDKATAFFFELNHIAKMTQ